MNLTELYKLRNIVDEINTIIETTLVLDRRDIERTVFELKTMNTDSTRDNMIAAVVHGLQHFDIFEQRLRHIVEINHSVCSYDADMPSAEASGNNIFALNQLQYEAAWADYISAISELQSLAATQATIAYPRLDFASNDKLARAAMPLVSARFATLIELTQGNPRVELECYRASVEHAYSTEKERVMLAMFTRKPDITLKEINAGGSTTSTESMIDLF